MTINDLECSGNSYRTHLSIQREINEIDQEIEELTARRYELMKAMMKPPTGYELKTLEVKSSLIGVCDREDCSATEEEYELIKDAMLDHPTWSWMEIAELVFSPNSSGK